MTQICSAAENAQSVIEHYGMKPHPEGGYYVQTYRSSYQVPLVKTALKNAKNGNHAFHEMIEQDTVHDDDDDDQKNGDDNKVVMRNSCTAILYLLTNGDFSAWHRIESDEMWHYYRGDFDLLVHVIDPRSGELTTTAIGTRSLVQYVVPAGHWFAVEPDMSGERKQGFALTGCTVSPGFHFDGTGIYVHLLFSM